MTMGWVMTSANDRPPVAGMPVEVWTWLRESMAVRPQVVARVRASLDAGHQASADDVALAILRGPWNSPWREGQHGPYRPILGRS